MENSRTYYAIIPASVRYDRNVCANAKLLYGEITALCNEKGFCWANNQYFMELYGVGKTTVIRWISELVDNGYIYKNIRYADDGKTVLQRCLSIAPDDTTSYQKCDEGSSKNDTRGGCKNDTYNNTVVNNTVNTTVDEVVAPQGVFVGYADGDKEIESALNDFEQMRKLQKSPMTERAKTLLVGKLDSLSAEVRNRRAYKLACLNNAILNNWKSVYAVKDFNDSAPPGQTHEPGEQLPPPAWLTQENPSVDDILGVDFT